MSIRFMLIRRAYIGLSVALALGSALFTTSAYGQSPATRPSSPEKDKEVAAAQGPGLGSPENEAVAPGPRPSDLESKVAAMTAENAAVRERLRKMEEQQKTLLELVDRLNRRLDGSTVAEVTPATQPSGAPQGTEASLAEPGAAQPSVPPAPPAKAEIPEDDRYQEGFVLLKAGDDAKVPFELRLGNITQFRYLNTQSSNDSFTDHLGNVREVVNRNDLGVNRSMFSFFGYLFDKRLKYTLFTWTSASSASIVVAGNVSWEFNKGFTLNTGYWGVPGARSLTFTFPYFTGVERSMADNFFRPGFTMGIWATGEPVKGLNYDLFIGNGLNTLGIASTKLDTNLVYSGSVWWEPLGTYARPGKARNSYDDYDESQKTVIRVGTSYTHSREDRFSNLDQRNPENTAMHNSDGVLTFTTGAFAPGVTVDKATYRMWAMDGGVKRRGLAINGQYYFRWLGDFETDGPLPLSSTFDHGGELSASYFVVPKKLMLYARGSGVLGQFGDSYEVAGGFKWYFVPTEKVWLAGELMRVNRSPYGGTFTPYTGGMTGWVPVVQTIFSF